MAVFSNHKLALSRLFQIIPEALFNQLSKETKVDYYTKVLYGKVLFYLLLYALLTDDKLGQRGIADLYASPHFRMLFNLRLEKKKISHSSLSERLSVVEIDYFKKLYEIIYERFSVLYPAQRIGGLKLQRVDSSLVAEASNKLEEGLNWGNENNKGKMLKYTISYDGMYGSFAKTHSEEKYANESLALPENVLEHFKKSEDHSNVYIFDRGQSSTKAFAEMQSSKGLLFVGRLVENRKLCVVKAFDLTFRHFSFGELKQDAIVQLYGYEHTISKNGNNVKRQFLAEEKYRVIRFRPQGKSEDILLITNIFYLRAETIALMYRRRWDIEVFFRFLKQEVNFSHFISLNKNGIEVMLYMTLIAAMMIVIYRKENEIGFKTAKRRMIIELQELIMAITVILSGGDLKKVDLSSP
jgi:hypothetical protein